MMLLLLLQLLFIPVSQADQVVVTSGRVVYDPFGRVVRVYHPTVDSERVDSFSMAVDNNVAPTWTEYDELDRPLVVHLPDETVTMYEYSLVGNALKTTVTDAKGNSSATLVNGSGKTVQSIQYKGGPDSEALTTAFAYDGIGRLVSVTDTEGNVTESTYDYGDRRTRVVHPASGETNYTYDRLGNVLTVQTANLKDGGSHVEYTYDRGRPTSVVYPEHPENNVYYHYGTADEPDTHNDLYGRLKFVEDGSGGTEYRYDAMGNVNRMRRTLSIPGEMVATANFEWRYDSFGKLLGMTYPAIRSAYGERVAYRYDRSGQLQSVYNNNTEGYYYARDIGYDRFGSQIHMEYGNGAVTDYAYIPTNRRLRNISVSTSGSSAFTFGRAYTYDRVGNILALTSSTGGTGTLFPPVSHEYRYDNLYRLVGSNGYTIDGGQMSAIDTMTMAYDDMYRITGKTLVMSQQNVQFDGTLSAGYTLGYNYNTATGRKFQMSSVTDVNYRVASATVSNSDKIDERHTYEYDRNGNITYAGTARKRGDRAYRDRTREEKFRWDEANRLLAISQDGYVSHYFYDASGERTVKMHGGNSAVFVNSQMSGRETGALSFSAYFNPYFSIHDGTRFTKHLYIGSERIASMTGELDEDYYDVANNNNIVHAGVEVYVNTNDLHIPYTDRCYAMRDSIDGNYSYFGLHSGLDWSGVQLRALSLPCHGEEDGNVNNGGGSIPRSQGSGTGNDYPSRYGSIWYFHKDHLGSSTLITDGTGSISQQVEYLPYGEVFLERQHNSDPSQPLYATPYKFNGKELDEETGLYYYGARYMNPRLSIWYATDPLQEKYPNISSYAFCARNPVKQFDINGCDWVSTNNDNTNIWSWTNTINNEEEALNAGYNGYLPNGSILNNARIGDGKCGAVYLGYSADDICYTTSNHDVTPWQVGVEWLTGKGPRHRDFTNGDYFSELLRQHSHYQESILLAMHELANGNYSGSNNYKLEGFEGVGKYGKDYSTLATGGLTGNLAVTYLGSYVLKWTSHVEGDYAVINFTINNSSTMESGTRPPVIGYTNWWKSSIGRWINESFQSGMGSKTTQTFRLTERIKMTSP